MMLAKMAGFGVQQDAAPAPIAFHDDLSALAHCAMHGLGAEAAPPPMRCLEPAGHLFDDGDLDPVGDLLAALTPAPPAWRPPPGLSLPGAYPSETPSVGDVLESADFVAGGPTWASPGLAPGYVNPTADHRTTVMLQRIAFEHTEETVAKALNDVGFRGTYDAVYVPRNRRKNTNLGYAFVNFTHPAYAAEAFVRCGDRMLGDLPTARACKVDYSSMQGVEFLKHAWKAPVDQAPALKVATSDGMGATHLAGFSRAASFSSHAKAPARVPGFVCDVRRSAAMDPSF